MHKIVRTLLTLTLVFFFQHQYAQEKKDSLELSLPQAEKIFLEKNLQLLAAQYDIDISKAYVQQARYWDNPVLNTDQNIYDGKFFRHNDTYGQVYAQLQELIRTAGKRNKLIQLAKDGQLTAGQQFSDLMRNLRYLLRTDFYSLHQLLETGKIYDKETGSLQKLVTGMDAQLKSGNISLKENIRIKSLLYSLQSDQADLMRQIADMQKDIHVLLQMPGDTIIVPVLPPLKDTGIQQLSIAALLDSAMANRPDLQLARTNLLTQQHNLAYQKSLAVPDVTAGIEFDQRSTYVPNYWGLTISLPIPILDRNKGNIKAATFSIKQAEATAKQAQDQSAQEVLAAYNKLLIASDLRKKQPPELSTQYDELLQHITGSYEQRQVGLLEFLDFFDAYKDARIKQLQQDANLRSAGAELDFTTGTNIIPIQ